MKTKALALFTCVLALFGGVAAAWAGDYGYGSGYSYAGRGSGGGSHYVGTGYNYNSGKAVRGGGGSYNYNTAHANRGGGGSYNYASRYTYASKNGGSGEKLYRYTARSSHSRRGNRYDFYRVGRGRHQNNGYTGFGGGKNDQHRRDYESYLERVEDQARAGTYGETTQYADVDLGDISPAAGPRSAKAAQGAPCGTWTLRATDPMCDRQGTRKWEPWMSMYD